MQLNLPHREMAEAFRRMVFNVAAKNCDDHSKNFSFLLRHGTTTWTLAPAYDVTFAHNPAGEWTSQHLMSVNGKYRDITAADLLAEAERFGIGEARDIIDDVRNALKLWQEFADTAGIAESEAAQVISYRVAGTGEQVMSTASLLWGLVFGSFGMGYFVYGKKQNRVVPLVCGLVLMVFPYVVSNDTLLAIIGLALMAAPFFIKT